MPCSWPALVARCCGAFGLRPADRAQDDLRSLVVHKGTGSVRGRPNRGLPGEAAGPVQRVGVPTSLAGGAWIRIGSPHLENVIVTPLPPTFMTILTGRWSELTV